MAAKHLHWIDAHFCGLRAQTNIYGLTKVATKDGFTTLIAASISGYYISVEYQKSLKKSLMPITREDVFFGAGIGAIPGPGGEAEIFEVVSVDIMCNAESKKNVILGVAYLKLEPHFEQKPSAHLSIYFLPDETDENPNLNIVDAIAQAFVQPFVLDFIPFKLMHQRIQPKEGESELCFLLAGNDNKVHVYRQGPNEFSFYEETSAVEKFFPEFGNIDGIVTQMEFRRLDDVSRLTVLGFQTGLVTLSKVNTQTNEVELTRRVEMDSPITSLHLYNQFYQAPCPEFLDTQECSQSGDKDSPTASPKDDINLLVTSALDPSMVFCDVLSQGLSKGLTLPHSNSRDVVLCSCVMDIDFDGENEILIGTYGQILLAYKFVREPPAPSALMTSTPYQSPVPVPVGLPDKSASASQVDSDRKLTETTTSIGKLELSSSRLESSLAKTDTALGHHDKSDSRRRHKSVAALLDNSEGKLDKMEPCHRSVELNALLDASIKDPLAARLVKSQENLTSPSTRSVLFATPDHLMTSEVTLPSGGYHEHVEYPCYRLTWSKRFADPVMGLTCEDVMADGMEDLVVLTLKGLHVLQPDLNEVAQLLQERMRTLVEPGSEGDDDYHRLQKETLSEEG